MSVLQTLPLHGAGDGVIERIRGFFEQSESSITTNTAFQLLRAAGAVLGQEGNPHSPIALKP